MDEGPELEARLLLANLQAYAEGAVGHIWMADHDEDMGEATVIDAEDSGPGTVIICETNQWPDDEEVCMTAMHIATNDPRMVITLTNALTRVLDLGGEPARIVCDELNNLRRQGT